MHILPKPFADDFVTINKHLEQQIALVVDGDIEKLVGFPMGPFLEKALEAESFKVYIFDAVQRLVVFIPGMPPEILFKKMLDFECRFSLTDSDKFDSLNEYLLTRRRQLATLQEDRADIEDVFSIFIFSGKFLIRAFDVLSCGAVIFALYFGGLNQLDFDEYNFDFSL